MVTPLAINLFEAHQHLRLHYQALSVIRNQVEIDMRHYRQTYCLLQAGVFSPGLAVQREAEWVIAAITGATTWDVELPEDDTDFPICFA